MISRGKVQIFRAGADAPVAVRNPGDFLAENALMEDAPAMATCRTADWCTLFLLRRKDFEVLCATFPEMAFRIKEHMKHKRASTAPGYTQRGTGLAQKAGAAMAQVGHGLQHAAHTATAVRGFAHLAREKSKRRQAAPAAASSRGSGRAPAAAQQAMPARLQLRSSVAI